MKHLTSAALATLLCCTVGFAGGYGHGDAKGDITITISEGQSIRDAKQFNADADQYSQADLRNASTDKVGVWSQGTVNSASNSFNGANNAISLEMDNLNAKGKIKADLAHNQNISCLKQINLGSNQVARATVDNHGGVDKVYDNSIGISNGASNDFNSAVNYVGVTADGLKASNISMDSAPCGRGCNTQSISGVKQANMDSNQEAYATVNMATVGSNGACSTCGRLGDVTDHSVGINNSASNSFNTMANVASYRFTDLNANGGRNCR